MQRGGQHTPSRHKNIHKNVCCRIQLSLVRLAPPSWPFTSQPSGTDRASTSSSWAREPAGRCVPESIESLVEEQALLARPLPPLQSARCLSFSVFLGEGTSGEVTSGEVGTSTGGTRGYWMINRGPGSLGSSPTLFPPLPSARCLSFSVFLGEGTSGEVRTSKGRTSEFWMIYRGLGSLGSSPTPFPSPFRQQGVSLSQSSSGREPAGRWVRVQGVPKSIEWFI